MADEYSKRLSKLGYFFRLPHRNEWFNGCNGNDFMNVYGTQDGSLKRNLANYGKEKCCGPDDSDGYKLQLQLEVILQTDKGFMICLEMLENSHMHQR